MSLPDNRIKFPATKIDFATTVGVSGQDHDSFPAPGQARYDHMRMFLIGLLAQQASLTEPIQYRDGTPWFDLNTFSLKIRVGTSWVSYADAIALTEPDDDGKVVTLGAWYAAVQATLVNLAPEVVFSGQCNANNVSLVNLPESIQGKLSSDSRVFLYVNGSLVNPHNCTLLGSPTPTTLRLSGVELSNGDTFVAVIRRISSSTFLGSSIVVP
jgi:hypothetical protein